MRIQPFQLERYFAQHEFSAPYLLGSSDCEAMTVKELLAMEPGSEEGLQNCWLGYTESAGDPLLRQEIAGLYDKCNAEEILVHSGAEEAIFIFMQVMLKPGDHVIVQSPCYQSLYQIAHDLKCKMSRWEPRRETPWHWDVEELAGLMIPETKAIIINQPHNPTGHLMNREEQQSLVDLARKNNLLLFSDEVYRELEHDPALKLPAACDEYEQAVSLGVMSKTYGLAGLRIGWVATRNKEIRKEMASFKDYTSICNSAPSEYLSLIGLRNRHRLVERNRGIVNENLKHLNTFFQSRRELFRWEPPKAGSIAFPAYLGKEGARQFCLDLIRQQGVLLVPSEYFQYGDGHFRIGFGRRNLPECLTEMGKYVRGVSV